MNVYDITLYIYIILMKLEIYVLDNLMLQV